MRTSGKAGFLSTRCRMFMIRRKGFWRPPTGASLPTATSIRSAPSGERRGGPIAFTGCSDRGRRLRESGKKLGPADMLALQMDVSSTYDRFCADKFVYAVDHAASASDRAKRAAEILRDWDGRMSADSAAPTIETKARQELARLLLEPKLGAAAWVGPISGAASGSASGALSWKSYRWAMSSVWLENVLTKQPARWLPPGYSDYGSLLTAAVENAVKQTGTASGVSAKAP